MSPGLTHIFLISACTTAPSQPREAPAPPSWAAAVPPTSDTPPDPSGRDTGTPMPEEPYACPAAADLLKGRYSYETVNPCVLDPTVALCVTKPYVDTHTTGLRLHQIVRRTDGQPERRELLLYLPPGPGDDNLALLVWGAYAGYTVIGLGWHNDGGLVAMGDTDAVLEEALHGTDATKLVDVGYADSADGRLEALFMHLLESDPTGGWDRWFDPRHRRVNWRDVVLMGWSDGAAAVAHLARDHEVDGAILISGPPPGDWLSEPRATPGCRQQAFYHQLEGMAQTDTLTEVFEPMGMSGPIVDVDELEPPYDDARIYTTALEDFRISGCNHHGAMAVDGCMDPALFTPYLHVLCSAAETDICP